MDFKTALAIELKQQRTPRPSIRAGRGAVSTDGNQRSAIMAATSRRRKYIANKVRDRAWDSIGGRGVDIGYEVDLRDVQPVAARSVRKTFKKLGSRGTAVQRRGAERYRRSMQGNLTRNWHEGDYVGTGRTR